MTLLKAIIPFPDIQLKEAILIVSSDFCIKIIQSFIYNKVSE